MAPLVAPTALVLVAYPLVLVLALTVHPLHMVVLKCTTLPAMLHVALPARTKLALVIMVL
jgi:hypothetical protein